MRQVKGGDRERQRYKKDMVLKAIKISMEIALKTRECQRERERDKDARETMREIATETGREKRQSGNEQVRETQE